MKHYTGFEKRWVVVTTAVDDPKALWAAIRAHNPQADAILKKIISVIKEEMVKEAESKEPKAA